MEINRTILWIGSAIYIASFFLVAVEGPGGAPSTRGPILGYMCAWMAVVAPWAIGSDWSRGVMPILMPGLLITGLINPVFIAGVIALLQRKRRSFVVLRAIVLSMIPFSWICFFFVLPREGYFLWTLGMLLVLFSNIWEQRTTPLSLFNSRIAS
jgi:hypothetical protein